VQRTEKSAQKTDILLRVAEADVLDLLHDAGDDDFQKALPTGTFQTVESLRVMSFEPAANTNISAHVNTIVRLT